MPLILVATDFSPTGDNAAFYGASLAQSWGCELLLLHSYFLPVTFNDPAMPIIPMDELQTANTSRMSKTNAALQEAFPDLKINSRIDYGDIHDILEDVIEEVKPLLLVIGSHGDENDSFLMGNTSAELLRNSKTPILAVPTGYAYQPVQKVCIAVDTIGMPEDAAFAALQSFLMLTRSSLHILHVTNETPAQSSSEPTMPIPAFDEQIPVRFHLTDAKGSVDEEIASFAAANGIDWLVVIPHHYSFWESLFHKSHTKAMIHKSTTPLLALH